MDHTFPREGDFDIDLESGTSEEEAIPGVRRINKSLNRVWSGVISFDETIREGDAVNSCNNVSNSGEVIIDNVVLLKDKKFEREEMVDLLEKNTVKETFKKKGRKKPPKPPRAPKAPLLDAVDQKMVREMSELATLKRARIERMKAMKKMKATKPASSSGNMCAMVITILFCLIILYQGVFSRSSSNLNIQGSPGSETRGGLMSVQYFRNLSATKNQGPCSGSLNAVEQVSGLNTREEWSRNAE